MSYQNDYKAAYAEWLCMVNELAYDLRMSIETGLPLGIKNEMLLASLLDDENALSIGLQQSGELRELCVSLERDEVQENVAWNIRNVLRIRGR